MICDKTETVIYSSPCWTGVYLAEIWVSTGITGGYIWTATHCADDVHESCVGGLFVSKGLDVEGSQTQRAPQGQQGQEQPSHTHQMHPGCQRS